jgi:cellobiose PTS system EIIA component
MEFEQIVFTIIMHAGNARSKAFDALRFARAQEFAQAAECMNNVKEELTNAHQIQSGMLFQEANGQKQDINMLLIHAQDHLMCAILAKDLVEEMILLYQQVMKNSESSVASTVEPTSS